LILNILSLLDDALSKVLLVERKKKRLLKFGGNKYALSNFILGNVQETNLKIVLVFAKGMV
jgi:hypothetical protein